MTNDDDDDDVDGDEEEFESVSIQVYIYDLSQGMARNLGQQLIGRPIEGIWHTAVVVHGKVLLVSSSLLTLFNNTFLFQEYFYGGGGIESCNPGGTQLGQPLKIEQVGEPIVSPVSAHC